MVASKTGLNGCMAQDDRKQMTVEVSCVEAIIGKGILDGKASLSFICLSMSWIWDHITVFP